MPEQIMPELSMPELTMPEQHELPAGQAQPFAGRSATLPASQVRTAEVSLSERLRTNPGLSALVAQAEATWRARAAAAGEDPTGPAWRTFEDAFPTFYEFTNRPR